MTIAARGGSTTHAARSAAGALALSADMGSEVMQ
jgi:hypothetical protein